MLDHLAVGIPVDKIKESIAFYKAALAPLGYEQRYEFADGNIVGLGSKHDPLEKKADLWISADEGATPGGNNIHYALTAKDRKSVDEFHAAAIAAGGKDNGAPGLREHHPSYYAAYVHDPVGNNIEVVCHIDV